MPTLTETVQVAPHMRSVGKHLLALVVEGKKMAADGKVTFDEVPSALSAIIRDLIPAIAEVNTLSQEAKEDLGSFLTAAFLDARDIAVVLLA